VKLVARLAVLALAVAGVATACGGGSSSTTTTTSASGTPVVEWANGFCTSFASWQKQLTSIGKDVVSSPSKDSLQKAADDVKAANQKLVDDLHGLGKPDTQGGDQVQTSVEDMSTTLNTQLTDIQNDVQNASGITGIASAIASISASLGTMGTALSTTITTIQHAGVKSEMKTAFQQAPSCRGVAPSS